MNKLKAINDFVIVKLVRKVDSKIILPDPSMMTMDTKFVAESVGEMVTKIKVGDDLVLAGYTVSNPNNFLEHMIKEAGDRTVRMFVKEIDVVGIVEEAEIKDSKKIKDK